MRWTTIDQGTHGVSDIHDFGFCFVLFFGHRLFLRAILSSLALFRPYSKLGSFGFHGRSCYSCFFSFLIRGAWSEMASMGSRQKSGCILDRHYNVCGTLRLVCNDYLCHESMMKKCLRTRELYWI